MLNNGNMRFERLYVKFGRYIEVMKKLHHINKIEIGYEHKLYEYEIDSKDLNNFSDLNVVFDYYEPKNFILRVVLER